MLLSGVLAIAGSRSAAAQASDNRNSFSTRPQIEAALAEAEKVIASPGYSGRIKDQKRREAAVLKSRLQDGDLQPGDQLFLSVQGEKDLTNTFIVAQDRTLRLPGVADVSVRGVLRAELEDYLTTELRRYLKDPLVHVQTTIRLSVIGAVGKPGFYHVTSSLLVGDAIMAAGGPLPSVDPAATRIDRSGTEIMSKEAFNAALNSGVTLDQLNLRAGDEIVVGGKRASSSGGNAFIGIVIPVLTAVVSLSYLITQVF